MNNSGRAKRSSMKKASENISATLTRKPITGSSKKRSGSSQKRETSCATSETTTDERSASISIRQEVGSQGVQSDEKAVQKESANTSALEDEELIVVVDEQKQQCTAPENTGHAFDVNSDIKGFILGI